MVTILEVSKMVTILEHSKLVKERILSFYKDLYSQPMHGFIFN